ncbi:MAG: hypothetical protein JF615_16060, partial [Asticcacaulis sp.]|nr:hypothetical protein [Asticcacaulis sp.]
DGDQVDDLGEAAEIVVEDAKEAARKVNWWAVAGYAAAVAAIGAVAGYAYYRSQQNKPKTRIEKLKEQLGLAEVDLRHLRSTINRFDAARLNQSRRQVMQYAKQATHKGAKKVAELTR